MPQHRPARRRQDDATIKLGELSRKLPTTQGTRTDKGLVSANGYKSKLDTLAEAGISQPVASRAEALTGRADLDDDPPPDVA